MIKHNTNLKLLFLVKFFLYFIICLKSYADIIETSSSLIVLGKDNAPVKIKIFSSLTCPHCANFHIKIVPKIKEKYIDTGKVQLIFIDFPLDQAALNASTILHCVNVDKQITFLDTIYEKQNDWVVGSNIDEINNNLKKIVKNLGISSEGFDNCLNNEAVSDKILNGRIDGQKKYSINSTPAIIINEKKFEGSANYKSIKKKIEKLI